MDDRPKCCTCPYWNGAVNEQKQATCNRFPPKIVSAIWEMHDNAESDLPELDATWFPVTDCDDWCGEHPDFPAWLDSQRKDAK